MFRKLARTQSVGTLGASHCSEPLTYMTIKFNLIYNIVSLIYFTVMITFWDSINDKIGLADVKVYEILFISFFVINYLYLGIADYLAERNVYYGLTKSSAQVMINFTIVIFTLVIINLILTGEGKMTLSRLSHLELLGVGFYFILSSIMTNNMFIRKYGNDISIKTK